jgi:hypothetical protein
VTSLLPNANNGSKPASVSPNIVPAVTKPAVPNPLHTELIKFCPTTLRTPTTPRTTTTPTTPSTTTTPTSPTTPSTTTSPTSPTTSRTPTTPTTPPQEQVQM